MVQVLAENYQTQSLCILQRSAIGDIAAKKKFKLCLSLKQTEVCIRASTLVLY